MPKLSTLLQPKHDVVEHNKIVIHNKYKQVMAKISEIKKVSKELYSSTFVSEH